jgi:AcrR family transcriptional regulator
LGCSAALWAATAPAAVADDLHRPRRTSAEVRRLLLDAAQELFAGNGFRGTSTREIASKAGVAEVLLFRNFGSKAELYSAAVMLPLTQFIEEWLEVDAAEWRPDRAEHQQRLFMARLYDIVAENRGLIISYMAMSAFEPDMMTGLEHAAALDQAFDQLAERAAERVTQLGKLPPVDTGVVTRAVVGMVVMMALMRDFGLDSDKDSTAREKIVDEMTQLVLHGVLHREPGPV